jgi:hypothetical protein
MTATVQAWSSTFRGNAADVLLMTISTYLDRRRAAYAREASILNSSGTGKSRTVDELAKTVITVPMCLRDARSRGATSPFFFSFCLQSTLILNRVPSSRCGSAHLVNLVSERSRSSRPYTKAPCVRLLSLDRHLQSIGGYRVEVAW